MNSITQIRSKNYLVSTTKMSSKYVKLTQESYSDGVSFKLDDQYYTYVFFIDENKCDISLFLTDVDAKYHYNILSMVLTFGKRYWHNFCKCGGSSTISDSFKNWINDNIDSIERDIKIEKIIE